MDFGIFGIGFHQIIFIMLIALIVFGPDKLPGIARQAGRYVNDLRRLTQEARGEIQALTKDLDLRGDLDSVKADLLELKNDLTSTGSDIMKDFQEVRKQVDLRDEDGNLMGQQREQYIVQVQDVASETPGEPAAIRVEETIRRETIIQEAVENEPAYGTENIEMTTSGAPSSEIEAPAAGIIRPARPEPALDGSNADEPPFKINSEVFASSLAAATPDPATAESGRFEHLELELRLLSDRWQDDRSELYNRIDKLEQQFLERLARIEQAVAGRYEEAQPLQGNNNVHH